MAIAIETRAMMEVDDSIDDSQLQEYQEWVEGLGTRADKVKINSLSMVAEDHMESPDCASKLYEIIRQPLISKSVSGDRKLPVVYVVDSILKNVKGEYTALIEKDAGNWLPVVYRSLSSEKQSSLKKVYNLWKDAAIFSEATWKELGACFSDGGGGIDLTGDSDLANAGIAFGKDGGILLMPQLRLAMQTILDDLQSDEHDELQKVSLERLASIDPNLLVKIKRTAEDAIRNGGASSATNSGKTDKTDSVSSFLVETRSPESIQQSKAWAKLKLDFTKETNSVVHVLQHMVLDASRDDKRYSQHEAMDMTNGLAAASATTTFLTNALQQIRKQEKSAASGGGTTGSSGSKGLFTVDKTLFTTEGLKKKNDIVVGVLYEIGLPFVSSADGRRFATQMELSNHLDALFRKGKLDKTIAHTEERGWYVSDNVWSGTKEKSTTDPNVASAVTTAASAEADMGGGDEAEPETFTTAADESRDRCVVCGINFKMFFDNDNGMYMYSNCREIEVLNDDAAAREKEDMLVHVTCWRALGSPEQLTWDQVLQDVMPAV